MGGGAQAQAASYKGDTLTWERSPQKGFLLCPSPSLFLLRLVSALLQQCLTGDLFSTVASTCHLRPRCPVAFRHELFLQRSSPPSNPIWSKEPASSKVTAALLCQLLSLPSRQWTCVSSPGSSSFLCPSRFVRPRAARAPHTRHRTPSRRPRADWQ